MTGQAGCRGVRQSLGVYVLGAIDPAERALVDAHLPTCPECREELADLAGLPALLRKIPVGDAERLTVDGATAGGEPSAELLHSLLARTAEARRARRWRGLVAAAAVVVMAVGAGAAATNLLSGGDSAPPGHHAWHTVAATDPATGAHMTVKYTPVPWGTLISVQVSGLKRGVSCQFDVTDSAGHRSVVGSWRISEDDGEPAWYPASSAISDQDLRGFELTANGKVLATAPAA